jgi:ATP-binding cassette subfamily B protein
MCDSRVIITHRIGAARIADRIIVMKNGRIVEEGRHSELIRKDTYYSKLYREQAKWYNDEAI